MSKIVTIPIEDATKEQLAAFAQQTLGLDVPKNSSVAAIKAKIAAAWDKDHITALADVDASETASNPAPAAPAPAPAAPAPAAPVAPAASSAGRMVSAGGARDPKVRLYIPSEERAGGNRAVFVGVNGRGILIPRDKEVDVAYRYYEALKNAVTTVHREDQETRKLISYDAPAYPFQVRAMPPQAEIDAWFARTQGQFAA